MRNKIIIATLSVLFVFTALMPVCAQSTELTAQTEVVVEKVKNEKVEALKVTDKNGFGITAVSMGVVFVGLIFLYLVFKLVGKVAFTLRKKKAMLLSGFSKEEAKDIASEPGEIFAAIAMALDEVSDEDHDDENMVLTMKNVVKHYSPWSSKIYMLREVPKR